MATMVGQVLNERYEILEKIGEGGMAIAYRGRDRLLGRVVAVKAMRPELATDSGFLARFRTEARAAAGITHEHIAAVYDTGQDGSYHYIVMEYVEGESLRDRLRREGPLPLEEALRIAAETATALDAAHAAGVIHRDIKPHNILLGRDGMVKVTDFGIARAAAAPAQSETSAVIGTVNYVSPEQARGEAAGPQGDIYSLGATLFEALTGKPPFNGGDRLAILHKHVYDRPRRPSELRPGLPPEVDSLVGHCLEKDLSRRFASAREFLSYVGACPRTEDTTTVRRVRGRLGTALSEGTSAAASWMLRRGIWAMIVIAMLAAIVAGVTQFAITRARADMISMPDILGMGNATARDVLAKLGLGYREVGAKPSEDVAAGAVLAQDPPAGVAVAVGTIAKVVLSEGPSHIVVPNVTQMSAAQAQRNLEAAGLTAGVIQQRYDDEVPAGYVASTLPAAGAHVVQGTTVDIVLSLGAEPVAPVGPPLPQSSSADGGREETLMYVIPADAEAEVELKIEIVNDEGKRTIYQGRHAAGERIPPQKIRVTSPTRARIFVDGNLRAERQYLP